MRGIERCLECLPRIKPIDKIGVCEPQTAGREEQQRTQRRKKLDRTFVGATASTLKGRPVLHDLPEEIHSLRS